MRIYLDHNATTPLRAEVLAAMQEVLRDVHGNPSSTHAEGARARALIEAARARVASAVGAEASGIVFTSGATEANHAAIRSAFVRGARAGRSRIVTSTIEHPSVVEAIRALEVEGARPEWIGVDSEGRIDLDALAKSVDESTALVSLIWANNETGVVQPVEEIVALARAHGAAVHLDATQCPGKLAIDLGSLGAESLSASAHKLNGPKGVGFVALAPGLEIEPWLRGGGQERGRRGGTENVAGIAGLGVACELAARELPERVARFAALRDRLFRGIVERIPGAARNGSAVHVLANTLSVRFPGVAGDVLVEALDLEGIAASSGAACHSGSVEPSRVLLAMGLGPELARASLRLSIGHGVDEAAIDRVLEVLPDLVKRVRSSAS